MADFPGASHFCQVCLVVEDLKKAMDNFLSLGVGPFSVVTVDTKEMPGVTYRGKPANYKVQAAMAPIGSWSLELLEHQRGDSVYKDFLDEHGEGLHHLAICVDNLDAARAEFHRRGFESIQGGPIPGINRDGWFEYFDARRDFGILIELLDWPEELEEQPTYPQGESVAVPSVDCDNCTDAVPR